MEDTSKSTLERRWTALGVVDADLAPAPNGTIAGPRSEAEPAPVLPSAPTVPPSPARPTSGLTAETVAAEVARLDPLARAVTVGDALASGGMGIVYRAAQPTLRREVAVKCLRPEMRSPSAIRAQLREAWVTGMLEHPSVVPIHLLARDDTGGPSLVMKRIEGIAWDELIDQADDPTRGALLLGPARVDFARDPLEFQLRVLIAVCHAVAFAHARGIVHLDLKPDNIMIGQFGEVYVLDWGIAAGIPTADGNPPPPWLGAAAAIKGVRGTPAWMAPELAAGDGAEIGVATDVYLLGSLLHAVIARTVRHAGVEVRDILATAFESRPYSYDATVPTELADLANRATARAPAARPASADAVRHAIEAFLGHRSAARMADEALGRIGPFAARLAGERTAPADGTAAEQSIRRAFLEIRFALQQSLEAWPENPRARDGLRQLLTAMTEFALTHRQLERAAECASELVPRDPALDRRVRALQAELMGQAERLRTLERDADPNQFHKSRSLLSLGAGVFFASWNFPLGALVRSGAITLNLTQLVAAWAVTVVAFGATAFLVRKTLLTTAWNKRIVVLFGSGFAAVGVFWSGLAALDPPGLPATHVVAVTHWVFIYFTLSVAFTMDRRALWIAPVIAALGAVAPVWPELGFESLGLGGFVLGAYLAWVWRRPRGARAA